MTDTSLTISARARILRCARSTLYYHKKQTEKDWKLKGAIESVLREHHGYGHRRIALALGKRDERSVLRVMKLFGIKPYRRRGKRYKKMKKQEVTYPNLLMHTIPLRTHHVWVADFTHIRYRGIEVCVGTVMDVYTRTIVGVSVLTTHSTSLVIQALYSALLNHPRPQIFHSDNGSEYNALVFREILMTLGIHISRSRKGCPWENGYQESFYGKFKVDLGDPYRFNTLGELVAEIYRTIHYYNTARIHTALRMPPRTFALLQAPARMTLLVEKSV
jgi:putative transposase